MTEGDGWKATALVMALVTLLAAVALLCSGAKNESNQQHKLKFLFEVDYDSRLD